MQLAGEETDRLVAEMQNVEDMIDAANQGREFADSEIHRAFVRRLVALSNRYISERFRSKVEAEDVVQSVFKSFFLKQRDEEYEIEESDDLWRLLAKITVAKTINKIKQFRTIKRSVSREIVRNENDGSSFFGANDQPAAVDSLVFQELLDNLFNRLPDNLQRIVCLKLQGYTHFEIGEIEKCSTRTVIRSLKKIRSEFESMEADGIGVNLD